MKKTLDKELYPEYVYPEHQPDNSGPPRESIVKLGKMITDRIPQKLGIYEKNPQADAGGQPRCAGRLYPMR